MNITITPREREGVVVLDLSGKLMAGRDAWKLRATLRGLKDEAKTRVVLNLKELAYVDGAGVGTMLSGFNELRRTGGNLVLLNLSSYHLSVLLLSRLENAFCIYDDEEDAIESFVLNRESTSFDVLHSIEATGSEEINCRG